MITLPGWIVLHSKDITLFDKNPSATYEIATNELLVREAPKMPSAIQHVIIILHQTFTVRFYG